MQMIAAPEKENARALIFQSFIPPRVQSSSSRLYHHLPGVQNLFKLALDTKIESEARLQARAAREGAANARRV